MNKAQIVVEVRQAISEHKFGVRSLTLELPQADTKTGREIAAELEQEGFHALFQTGLGTPFLRVWK